VPRVQTVRRRSPAKSTPVPTRLVNALPAFGNVRNWISGGLGLRDGPNGGDMRYSHAFEAAVGEAIVFWAMYSWSSATRARLDRRGLDRRT
jgi:hypothetical protein